MRDWTIRHPYATIIVAIFSTVLMLASVFAWVVLGTVEGGNKTLQYISGAWCLVTFVIGVRAWSWSPLLRDHQRLNVVLFLISVSILVISCLGWSLASDPFIMGHKAAWINRQVLDLALFVCATALAANAALSNLLALKT
jgi:hypothetical protein